jgi:hypothetical protein
VFFLFIGFTFVILKIGILLGLRLNSTISVLTLLLALVVSNFVIGIKNDSIKLNIWLLFLLALLAGVSLMFIDLTFDGQAYHQEISIQIANQWNPLYESIDESNNQSLWVNHYARAFELIGAVFFTIFKTIKITKITNFIFLFISFLYIKYYLKSTGYSKSKSFKIALIVALNPILITQLTTSLIDGLLYATSIITVCSFLLIKKKKSYFIDFAIGFLILINIKFTGIVFGIFIYLLLMVNAIIQKDNIFDLIKRTVLLFIISIPFVITPYIKNFNENGHPLYPLMGENKVDFVEDYVPDILIEKSKISRLLLTSFLSTGNRADAKVKIPFTFTKNELQKLRNGGARAGDFGVWWGGILIISIGSYLFYLLKNRKKFKISIFEFSIFTILLLMFLNKAGWWLRYTPYFWLLPLLMYFSVSRYTRNSKLLNGLTLLVLINSGLIFSVSLGLRYIDSNRMHNKLIHLKKINDTISVDFNALLGNKQLLKEYKINYIEGDSKDFKHPIILNNVVIFDKDGK